MASPLACDDANVDQVAQAAKELRAAVAAVPRAEQRARQLVEGARATVEDARRRLAEAIVDEYLEGDAKVGELARSADYSRETVRRILRAAGVTASE